MANSVKIARDRPGQFPYEIFRIERRVQWSKSWPSLFKAGAWGHQRRVPLQNACFWPVRQ